MEGNNLIDPKTTFDFFVDEGVEFFTGVPDSLLKDFTSYIYDNVSPQKHVITANEGAAIALATGIYLATGKPALVYMQNSGIGNAINPLLSLADPEVYSIPMVLLIGWRGMPGVKDEPQHLKQGRVQNSFLDSMEIPYRIIKPDSSEVGTTIHELINLSLRRRRPVALIIVKDTFSPYISKTLNQDPQDAPMSREYALTRVIESLDEDDLVVSTTGMASREIFEIRERTNSGHHRDFLTVGSMGHCSQIALGIALECPKRRVYCIDGDGAFIMHMGSIAIIGQTAPPNLKHIVMNNSAHDSVGGQPTAASVMDLTGIGQACNYTTSRRVATETELIESLTWLKDMRGPALLEIKVKTGYRKDLGRPSRPPLENLIEFTKYIQGGRP